MKIKTVKKIFILSIISICIIPNLGIKINAAEVPPYLLELINKRNEILDNLIKPVVDCWLRSDTSHSSFNGCIDWHSACHAGWAILAYSRVTGKNDYIGILAEKIEYEKIKKEFSFLKSNPNFEMPYGRAWFLRFAIESHRKFGDNYIQEMARYVSESLINYYENSIPNPISYEYNNDSWALVNLLDYSKECNDLELEKRVQRLVKEYYIKTEKKCDIKDDKNGFMAVCSNWAWLVSKATDRSEFLEWYNNWGSDVSQMTPIKNPNTAHEFGLNFNRAWSLFDLFDATLDHNFLKCYSDHFKETYNNPSHWKGNYQTVGHWVAQFGIFAALPLFGSNQR